MPAKELTAEQKADAVRLKALFEAWQVKRKAAGEKWSQQYVAGLFGHDSQSAVSQYLTGKIPLNPVAASKFAEVIECKVQDFSPTIASQLADLVSRSVDAGAAGKATKGDLFHQPTDEDMDVFHDFLLLIDEDRKEVIDLIKRKAAMARKYAQSIDAIRNGQKAVSNTGSAHVRRRRGTTASVDLAPRLRQRWLEDQLSQGTEDD